MPTWKTLHGDGVLLRTGQRHSIIVETPVPSYEQVQLVPVRQPTFVAVLIQRADTPGFCGVSISRKQWKGR